MGESTAKITVDMDARRVQQQAEGIKQKFHETKDKAHGIGQELEHMGRHLERHIVSAGAILKAFEAIGKSVREYQKGAIEASKALDENTISRGAAGASLGLTAQQTEALTAPGVRSRKERTSDLATLAGIRLGGNRKLSTQEVFRASNLLNTGAFTQEEVTEALRRGSLGELEKETSKRFELLGEEGQEALSRQAADNQTKDTVEEINASRVGRLRAGENRVAVRNARHPVAAAFQSAVGDFTSHVGGKDIIEFADTGINAHAARTADATERTANALDRPALPPPVE